MRTATSNQLPAPARVLRIKSSPNLGHDQQSHVHAFVICTANYRTYDHIFTRFGGSGQVELLLAYTQEQVPALHFGPVARSQKGEAMDRSVAVPRFCLARRNSQQDLLS